MPRRILIINGHPDARPQRFAYALADAYQRGAQAAGHHVRRVDAGALDFPVLRTAEEFASGPVPATLHPCQEALLWAEHLVLVFPLWLGAMPAQLKALLEQLLRPGVAFVPDGGLRHSARLLSGRSARILVTMGMPASVYRWYFRAHSLHSLERNILAFCGFRPVRSSIIGAVESLGAAGRSDWLERVEALGSRAG